jgi:hypothetical protein
MNRLLTRRALVVKFPGPFLTCPILVQYDAEEIR